MLNLNQVILCGRLVRDPDMRATQSGVSVTNFSIAVERDFNKGDNKESDFISCIAWRNTAEFIAKHFTKGSAICVTGAIRTSNYTDKDGKKVYKTDVEVREAKFVEPKNSGGNGGGNKGGDSYAKPSAPKFEEVDEDDESLPF